MRSRRLAAEAMATLPRPLEQAPRTPYNPRGGGPAPREAESPRERLRLSVAKNAAID